MSQNRSGIWLVGLAASSVALVFLVYNNYTDAIDLKVRDWATGHNTITTVTMWEYISIAGSVEMIVGLTIAALGLLLLRHDRAAAQRLGLAIAGTAVLEVSIKGLVHRARPEQIYDYAMPTSYSFPSGHALYSLAFYFTMAALLSRSSSPTLKIVPWFVAFMLVTAIGLSRIFLGVHYVSDVAGGYLISSAWLMVLNIWFQQQSLK